METRGLPPDGVAPGASRPRGSKGSSALPAITECPREKAAAISAAPSRTAPNTSEHKTFPCPQRLTTPIAPGALEAVIEDVASRPPKNRAWEWSWEATHDLDNASSPATAATGLVPNATAAAAPPEVSDASGVTSSVPPSEAPAPPAVPQGSPVPEPGGDARVQVQDAHKYGASEEGYRQLAGDAEADGANAEGTEVEGEGNAREEYADDGGEADGEEADGEEADGEEASGEEAGGKESDGEESDGEDDGKDIGLDEPSVVEHMWAERHLKEASLLLNGFGGNHHYEGTRKERLTAMLREEREGLQEDIEIISRVTKASLPRAGSPSKRSPAPTPSVVAAGEQMAAPPGSGW